MVTGFEDRRISVSMVPRMRNHLFKLAAIASFALCALLATLSVADESVAFPFMTAFRPERRLTVRWNRALVIDHYKEIVGGAEFTGVAGSPEERAWLRARDGREYAMLGFRWESHREYDGVQFSKILQARDLDDSTRLVIPSWFVFFLTAGFPASWAFWMYRNRHVEGRCDQCGYDLRCSTTRCPECGSAIPNPSGTSITEPKNRAGSSARLSNEALPR